MTEEVKQHLWTEFKFNNHPKYYKYFDTWIENLTENQILYYIKWPLSPTGSGNRFKTYSV